MKTPSFLTKISLAAATTVFMAQDSFAQGFRIAPQGSPRFNEAANVNDTTFIQQFGRVIDLVGVLVGLVAILMLIYSGFLYITAGGDDAKTKKGRAGIINAVIGIVIIVAAYTIIRFAVTGAVFVNNVSNGQSSSNGIGL